MPEPAEHRDWSDEELDLIVADYFAMLDAERAGHQYVKARHNAALRERINRSRGSIEFKYANISAVLHELALPAIRGYAPRSNYQQAIFPAIERYLTAHRDALGPPGAAPEGIAETVELFAEPPPARGQAVTRPPGLERLVRKFDPGLRDLRNRQLGEAGERLVFESERRRLHRLNRADLASKVRWISQEDGDGAGYDVLSFDHGGAEKFIEVKTTTGTVRTPFYLTCNEHAVSLERPDAFMLYRLYEFAQVPRMFELRPPLNDVVLLETAVFRASFGQSSDFA